MSTRLYIEPEAEDELENAAERYEEAVPGPMGRHGEGDAGLAAVAPSASVNRLDR